MDCLQDDFYNARNDFVGGIDNEALDFSQLEHFINDETEGGNTYFVDTLGHESSRPQSGSGTTVLVVETQPGDGTQQQQHGARLNGVITNTTYTHSHNLPESPPDSGSEPPYSPQQDGNGGKHSPHQKHGATTVNQSEILLHPSALYTHPSLKTPTATPLGQSHIPCEPLLIQHPVLTPLLTANSAHSRDTILLGRSEAAILLNTDTSPLLSSSVLNGSIGSPVLLNQSLHSPGGLISQATQISPPVLAATTPTAASQATPTTPGPGSDTNITSIYTSLQSGAKKRKLSQDLSTSNSGPVLYVKQEKQEPNIDLSPDSNSSQPGMLDDDYNLDGSVYMDSSYQCIRFQSFQQTQWHSLCDQNLKELPIPHYRVDADKGFNFSNADDAFVCQKKNHFQITCHTQLLGDAQFVKTPEGLKKISSFFIHFYGVKVESPTQTIKVEQSQSDRSKKPFHPVLVELQGEQVTKVTVGRLHFSETTSNNMRKKGKPNPDQRYFYLVVGLHAHTCDSNYQIVCHASERIIVRASNPGQFESDVELCWQKGHTSESIYHAGRVGINTDRPDESLVVHGNLKVTGHIVQPSDARAKLHVEECDTREQLRNIEQIRVVRYRYAAEFADQAGLKEDTGVIAQEVREILPDAVRPGGDVTLPNGDVIDDFLVVNKERIFMENLGAVKELCKVTDNLGKRIDEVERVNRRLAKMRQLDSFKSTSSSSTVSSKMDSYKLSGLKGHSDKWLDVGKLSEGTTTTSSNSSSKIFCSNRSLQVSIGIVVMLLTVCLVAMATLYFLEIHNKISAPRSELSSMKQRYNLATTRSHYENRTRDKEYFRTRDKAKAAAKSFPTDSSQEFASVRGEAPLTDRPEVDSSPLTPRSPPVLGRPPECGGSGPTSLYNDGDTPACVSYCCNSDSSQSEDFVVTSDRSTSESVGLDSSGDVLSSRIVEEENPASPGSNNIDQRKKSFKELSGRNKHSKKTVRAVRRVKRDPDDLIELENSNLDLSNDAWYHSGNGVSVTILASTVNQTLGPDFCALYNNEYTHCIDRNSVNSTYHVPLSRYLPDEHVVVQFQVKHQRAVKSCEKRVSETECTWQRRPESVWPNTPADSNSMYYVDISSYASVAVRYRVSLNASQPLDLNLCELKDGLGMSFLEFNLFFYRDCDD